LSQINPPEKSVYDNGWEDHELQQMLRLAKLPFSEKLAWLEEAHRLVRQIEASKRSPRD
jgi:hypothetical protein